MDHKVPKFSACPMVRLDLTRDSFCILCSIILSVCMSILRLHVAPHRAPGSSRHIPIYNPPPCRSDKWPDGLPGLTGILADRVRQANDLYAFTGKAIIKAISRGMLVCCENPRNSFAWQTSLWRDADNLALLERPQVAVGAGCGFQLEDIQGAAWSWHQQAATLDGPACAHEGGSPGQSEWWQ